MERLYAFFCVYGLFLIVIFYLILTHLNVFQILILILNFIIDILFCQKYILFWMPFQLIFYTTSNP